VIAKLRREDGFGLIELITALVILNIAIFALFAMFQAGVLSISRAGRTSTAAVLAEKQLELYRSLLYQDIGLNDTLVTAASSDSVHTSDTAEWNGGVQEIVSPPTCTPAIDRCKPVRTSVSGPDNHVYRIDTYIRAVTPSSGRPVKQVTVAVRKQESSTTILAELTATFDLSTGCVYGSTTAPC
jgi:type II secretory pathway pseudopilin PulG